MKKFLPFVERLFSLMVVFLMLVATTLWSGTLFGQDWLHRTNPAENVETMVKAPSIDELNALGLAGKTLEPRDSVSWFVGGKEHPEGVVVSSVPFTEDVIGYVGNTPLFIYFGENGKVLSVAAMDNDETPSFFRRASEILDQWDGLAANEALKKEVDVVTGATYSSLSLIENARSVLSFYAASNVQMRKAPVIGWWRTSALFAVFVFGLVVAWRYRNIKWLRTVVLLLNVGVTGFWCGQFLSLSIFHGWIQNGVDIMLYLPTVVMLGIALIMPYFGKKNHYCLWMCPYGSLQELAWYLPLPKIKVGAKVYKWMVRVRLFLLVTLLASLWMGIGFSVLDYEPFSAFIWSSALPAVMILAGGFVVLGIFIPHPWCQCVCPVGALLNLAEEKK